MVGITSYGAYIPFYRMDRQVIANAWGKRAGAGEKAVAGGDEDVITMGVAAAGDCLTEMDRSAVDAIFFATTTPPYVQKQSASIAAAALNLKKEILSMDIGHSLRGGTGAFRAALDAVKSGSAVQAMAVVSDSPLPPPDSPKELEFGDGAAAFCFGGDNIVATIEAHHTVSSEFMDTWRLPGDRHAQEWEDRFIREKGYLRLLPEAVSVLCGKTGLQPADFTKVVYNGTDARSHSMAAKKMGFDYKQQVQDPLYGTVGNTGAASAPMMLVAALEEAKTGDRILLANYGDGVDVFVLAVTEEIEKIRNRRGIRGHLSSKMPLPSYGKYLHYRDLMEWEVDRRPAPRTSLTHYHRESDQLFGMIGQRCLSCGKEQFPKQRICMWCQKPLEKGATCEDVPLAEQTGTLFTFSMDERAPVPDLPNVICVVDLEGGARYYGLMTDRKPEEIRIGQKMEFTFRKINDAQGVHNYFWKVRPVRN